MIEGQLLKAKPHNGCQKCGKSIPLDQKIGFDGMVVCGDCYIHMQDARLVQMDCKVIGTQDVKVVEAGKPLLLESNHSEISSNDIQVQLMQMAVDHEERLLKLEERLNQLDVQFTSICG